MSMKPKLGLVSVSDRASAWRRQGHSRLRDWCSAALRFSVVGVERLIPDDRRRSSAPLIELCDEQGCQLLLTSAVPDQHRAISPGSDHGRGGSPDAGLRRTDAADLAAPRADGHPVPPGRRHPRTLPDPQPARPAEIDPRDA